MTTAYNGEGNYRLFDQVSLLNARTNDENWVIRDMVPLGGRTVFYGKGGCYKSTAAMDLTLAMSLKRSVKGKSDGKPNALLHITDGDAADRFRILTHGRVLYLAAEGSKVNLSRRYAAHLRMRGAAPADVSFFLGNSGIHLDRQGKDKSGNLLGMYLFLKLIEETDPALIILDPLRAFLSTEENDNTKFNAWAARLDELVIKPRERKGKPTGILIVHHATKDDDLRGASAIYDWADSVVRFQKAKPEDSIKPTKGKGGQSGLVLPLSWRSQGKSVRPVTLTCTKQKDGIDGWTASVVPVHSGDEESRLLSFPYFDGKDMTTLQETFYALGVYEYLISKAAADPKDRNKTAICQGAKLTSDGADAGIFRLEELGYIQREGYPVPTGVNRTRKVPMYTPVHGAVDVVRRALLADEDEANARLSDMLVE